MEKERAREEERTERPSLAEQERQSDATNLNSKHGASGADRIRHYYNREGTVKS